MSNSFVFTFLQMLKMLLFLSIVLVAIALKHGYELSEVPGVWIDEFRRFFDNIRAL